MGILAIYCKSLPMLEPGRLFDVLYLPTLGVPSGWRSLETVEIQSRANPLNVTTILSKGILFLRLHAIWKLVMVYHSTVPNNAESRCVLIEKSEAVNGVRAFVTQLGGETECHRIDCIPDNEVIRYPADMV